MIIPMAIANIERVDIITEGSGVKIFNIDTASEASMEANVSAGVDNELRVKNRILAQTFTEDILKGYNITFKDALLSPDFLEVIEGGTSTAYTNDATSLARYDSSAAGNVSNRTRFWTYIYTAENDYNGDVLRYKMFMFPHCIGSPVSFSFRDGEFYSPSYTVKSKPKKGESAFKIIDLAKLPIVVTSVATMPASPVASETSILIAVTPTTLLGENQTVTDIFSDENVKKGNVAIWNGTKWNVR